MMYIITDGTCMYSGTQIINHWVQNRRLSQRNTSIRLYIYNFTAFSSFHLLKDWYHPERTHFTFPGQSEILLNFFFFITMTRKLSLRDVTHGSPTTQVHVTTFQSCTIAAYTVYNTIIIYWNLLQDFLCYRSNLLTAQLFIKIAYVS